MKVLFISTYYKPAYRYGGTVRADSALCEALVEQGVRVDVLTTDVDGKQRLNIPLRESIDVNGVNVYYFPIDSRKYFFSRELANVIKSHVSEYDLVVIQALWGHPFIVASDSCIKKNIPFIVLLHGQLLPWSINQKKLKKLSYLQLFVRKRLNRAYAIHCTHLIELTNLNSLGITAPPFVVPNMLDTRQFNTDAHKGQFRDKFRIPSDSFVLLFFGRLHPKKNPQIALETLLATITYGFDAHLLFVGPDEVGMKTEIVNRAIERNTLNRIHFTGLLRGDEILAALADSDLLLMPSESQSENFGMSAVEAMAAGVPILVSEGVPVGKEAELAGAGWVLKPHASAFSKKTIELISDKGRMQKMGERGKIHARNKYDKSVVVRQMIAQYESILNTGKPMSNLGR